MGLRDFTVEGLAEQGPALRRAGFRSIEYADDGSISRVEFEPRHAAEVSDTEPCPPPSASMQSLRRPEIPPAPAVPTESGVVAIMVRDTDPHPEMMRDDEPVSDRVARENGWLATNGRSP